MDGNKFIEHVKSLIKDNKKNYLLVDEIQKMDDFGIITMGIYYFLLNEDSLDIV